MTARYKRRLGNWYIRENLDGNLVLLFEGESRTECLRWMSKHGLLKSWKRGLIRLGQILETKQTN